MLGPGADEPSAVLTQPSCSPPCREVLAHPALYPLKHGLWSPVLSGWHLPFVLPGFPQMLPSSAGHGGHQPPWTHWWERAGSIISSAGVLRGYLALHTGRSNTKNTDKGHRSITELTPTPFYTSSAQTNVPLCSSQ